VVQSGAGSAASSARIGTIPCFARLFLQSNPGAWGQQLARMTPDTVGRAVEKSSRWEHECPELRDAGMKVVLGATPGKPASLSAGWTTGVRNWVWMGLTPAEAIVAATRDSAEAAHIIPVWWRPAGPPISSFWTQSPRKYRQLTANQQGLPSRSGVDGAGLKARCSARVEDLRRRK